MDHQLNPQQTIQRSSPRIHRFHLTPVSKERHPSEGTSPQRRLELGLGSSIYNSGFQAPLERRSITPAPERHPSEGTSPQRRNVTPAKAGAGAGIGKKDA